mmetsp:Transcript_26874/g.49410  ORF Transcript_26874/g.49410 Transcript_26874/m.49410 type:complete len:200 (-) Transcript_26874:177-776(-)
MRGTISSLCLRPSFTVARALLPMTHSLHFFGNAATSVHITLGWIHFAMSPRTTFIRKRHRIHPTPNAALVIHLADSLRGRLGNARGARRVGDGTIVIAIRFGGGGGGKEMMTRKTRSITNAMVTQRRLVITRLQTIFRCQRTEVVMAASRSAISNISNMTSITNNIGLTRARALGAAANAGTAPMTPEAERHHPSYVVD